MAGKGIHFDPDIVDAYNQVADECLANFQEVFRRCMNARGMDKGSDWTITVNMTSNDELLSGLDIARGLDLWSDAITYG